MARVMARHPAQLDDRGEVGGPAAPRLPQSLADRIAQDPIVFIDELADLLGTSRRTIERQLRAGTFFIPEAPKVDYRHRWSRARVYAAIESTTLLSHRQTVLGPRLIGKPAKAAK